MRTGRSKRLMKRGREVIPGGVNSPVRAFGYVGGQARFIRSASGARLEDEDGNRYVDWVASWGAILVGHAHPIVLEAVRAPAPRGTSFGAPPGREIAPAGRGGQLGPRVVMLRVPGAASDGAVRATRPPRRAHAR